MEAKDLAAETVQGAALALERVDDIHGGDGLSASVLGVGHGITDDVLEEDLEDTAGLLVDQAGDALDATTASHAADGGLGDALNVVAEYLAVALGAALAQSLVPLAMSRRCGRGLLGALGRPAEPCRHVARDGAVGVVLAVGLRGRTCASRLLRVGVGLGVQVHRSRCAALSIE